MKRTNGNVWRHYLLAENFSSKLINTAFALLWINVKLVRIIKSESLNFWGSISTLSIIRGPLIWWQMLYLDVHILRLNLELCLVLMGSMGYITTRGAQ